MWLAWYFSCPSSKRLVCAITCSYAFTHLGAFVSLALYTHLYYVVPLWVFWAFFLLFFALVPLVYFLCSKGCAPLRFWYILLTYKKKISFTHSFFRLSFSLCTHVLFDWECVRHVYTQCTHTQLERCWYLSSFISGTRYGASLRKQIKKMEVSQHSKYFCEFCGKVLPLISSYCIVALECSGGFQCMHQNHFIEWVYSCSLQWRGKLLESGVARIVEKWKQEVLTHWSKDFLKLDCVSYLPIRL